MSALTEVGIRLHNKKKKKEVSEEQKQEIQEAFALFDTDKDDAIDYYELKVCPREGMERGAERRCLIEMYTAAVIS